MRRKSGVHICVGVSNAEASVAWGLHLGSGQMRRWSRNAAGQVCGVPTPAGFPNGHRKQVLFDESGRPRDLGDVCTSGRVIDVVFDSDAGTLGFRIDRGPLLPGLSGFPKQVSMRPFVRIGESDRVSRSVPVEIGSNDAREQLQLPYGNGTQRAVGRTKS